MDPDIYLLESGAPDGYLLEDSSGVLLLEQQPGSGEDPYPYTFSADGGGYYPTEG